MSLESQVTQYIESYGIKIPEKPKLPTVEEGNLMAGLITEALMELNEGLDNENIVEIAESLTQIIHVTATRAVSLGFPADELLQEMHKFYMESTGTEPDISGILSKHLYPEDNRDFRGHIQ